MKQKKKYFKTEKKKIELFSVIAARPARNLWACVFEITVDLRFFVNFQTFWHQNLEKLVFNRFSSYFYCFFRFFTEILSVMNRLLHQSVSRGAVAIRATSTVTTKPPAPNQITKQNAEFNKVTHTGQVGENRRILGNFWRKNGYFHEKLPFLNDIVKKLSFLLILFIFSR